MAKAKLPTKRKAVIRRRPTILGVNWSYVLIGDNGKVLTVSETMKRRRSCVEVCKKYFPDFKIVFE